MRTTIFAFVIAALAACGGSALDADGACQPYALDTVGTYSCDFALPRTWESCRDLHIYVDGVEISPDTYDVVCPASDVVLRDRDSCENIFVEATQGCVLSVQ